jgi:hypothetical protein
MPIEVGFWNVTRTNIKKISYSVIESEKRLEEIITKDISIVDDNLLLIGKQIKTAYGKSVDILTIDQEGKVTIIELKRNRTPREVVAQALDYASWVQDLSYTDISKLFKEKNDTEFEKEYENKFGIAPPEKINQEHDILVVCSELDSETERIINYLSDNYNVPINVVFFRFFHDSGADYLSRSWLIDPNEVIERSSKSKSQSKGEAWNGRDFVVNIDVFDGLSTWEDSQRYGFISAGGGKWYSRSLNQLFPGARIFAMIPKKGYIGVGFVTESSVPIKEFNVTTEKGEKVSILDVPLKCEQVKENADDFEKCEYLVRVNWKETRPEQKAYWDKGMRANQNSAFKLKNTFTLNKLLNFFQLEE